MLTPGPVPVLDRIAKAQTQGMITHRSKDFTRLYGGLVERARGYFNCHEAFVLTGSGATGLEALVVNLVPVGAKSLVLTNGEFGDNMAKTFMVFGKPVVARLEDGQGWNLERSKEKIDAYTAGSDPAIALGILHNETSMGVRNDVAKICAYAKSKGMITIVDGISAWPGTPMNMIDDNIDGYVVASQKGPGAPPGLAMIGLSETAVSIYRSRTDVPSYTLDLKRHGTRFDKDKQTPNTPAIATMYALVEAFNVIDELGGLEASVRRHEEGAKYTRERLTELLLPLISEAGFESNTVTGFVASSAEKAKAIKEGLAREGIQIVGSRGKFEKTGLRVAHMANFTREELVMCFDTMARILTELRT